MTNAVQKTYHIHVHQCSDIDNECFSDQIKVTFYVRFGEYRKTGNKAFRYQVPDKCPSENIPYT